MECRRPKTEDTEEDLLRLQQEFLSSENFGTGVSIKRPDKRKSETEQEMKGRDVVHMEGIETSHIPTTLSDVPFKRSKFLSGKEEEKDMGQKQKPDTDSLDVEELMDSRETGLAAVLTTIIERDTKSEIYVAPPQACQAFPSVLHMDKIQSQEPKYNGKKKKSLFAQQVGKHGARHFGVEPAAPTARRVPYVAAVAGASLSEHIKTVPEASCIIDGCGLSVSNRQEESSTIHQENVQKLANMSEAEILEEQKKLLGMIDPKLVEFLKNKRKTQEKASLVQCGSAGRGVSFSVHKGQKKQQKTKPSVGPESLPVQPHKSWLHMDEVETNKMEWMKDLPPPSSTSSETGKPARFDFKGQLLAVDADFPVNQGLHHHGDEPERAGYTLEEMFQLARSSNLQQRVVALHTLARVVAMAQTGQLEGCTQSPILPTLLSGGLLILLRWALDDSVEAVVAAAVDAIHALVYSPLDEEACAISFTWHQGHVMPALTPTKTLEKEMEPQDQDEENKEEETDADVAKRDVVLALVTRMDLLSRFRYILKTMRPQAVIVVHMLQILSRLARHSTAIAYEIVKCPGLMENIVRDFLPTAWSTAAKEGPVSDVYGLPVPAALALVRNLCQAGRNITSVLISQFNLTQIILRYLAVKTIELELKAPEAEKLQFEAFCLWSVCLLYGLGTQVYFDLYSDLVITMGKLVEGWSAIHSEQTSSASLLSHGTGQQHLNTILLCALEKVVLNVQGFGKPQGFSSSHPEPQIVRPKPAVDISHVITMYNPVRTVAKEILTDIGTHYPAKKHCLAFPTSCVNFLATFYNVEATLSDVDEVARLQDLEDLSSSCLKPFLKSFGFTRILEHLVSRSNILSSFPLFLESCPSLPSLGVSISVNAEDDHMHKSSSDDQREKNMPILLSDSPFGFLTALLRLTLSVCQRHKGLIKQLLEPIVGSGDICMYLKKVCSVITSPMSSAYLTKAENLFHYFWLKCFNVLPGPEASLAHQIALRLFARLNGGDEHLAHDLMTCVIFNPSFIREGDQAHVATAALASMNLSETLCLKSATDEELHYKSSQLLSKAHSALATIRGHFLMAFGGMENAVQASRNLYMGDVVAVSSQLAKHVGESLMPKDWTFLPLIHIYNKMLLRKSVAGRDASPLDVSMVTSVLQWNYLMEMLRPAETDQISATIRLSRIFCVFLAGNSLFLETIVHQYLAGLLCTFATQKVLDKLDFEENIPGIPSFYDLYQEFLDHYEAVSFGDPVFGLYLLLPLQQQHSVMLRRAVWGERRKLLRTLCIPLNELLIPVTNFLEPEESDLELVQLYFGALMSQAVQPNRAPVLYLIAVHHVNRFLYRTLDSESQAMCSQMWAQIRTAQDLMTDAVYYKQKNLDLPKGLQLYEPLPPSRQAVMDFHFKS